METWKVAIALSMASNHASVLSALASGLLGVEGQVNKLNAGFSRLKLAIGGALSVTAGGALFGVMGELVDKTKDYSDELVKLERLGGSMSQAVLSGDIGKRAFDISQRVPMKVTDLMKIPGSTYSIIGQEESMKFWEPLARFSFVMKSQKDYKGDSSKDLQNVIRAGELSGRITDPTTKQIDPERLQRWLDLSAEIMAATHNVVNPQTLLGMAQQGGFALRGLSDEGFMTQAIVAQAMGGQRSGTALMSLWQQMAGGTMFTRTAEGMEKLGLLKSGEWRKDNGRVILGDEASKRLTKLIGKDPLDFIHNITDNLKKRGITDPQDQARMVQRALNRATTQRYTIEQVMNLQQIEAERGRMRKGYGVESSFRAIMNKSVGANMEALKTAWDNLLVAVAGPNSGNVVSALQSLTGAINSMTRTVSGMNPETLKLIGEGLAALSIGLIGAGGLALLAALGPAGWIVLGAVGVAEVMHLLSKVDWKGLGSSIAGLAAAGWAKITSGFDTIKNAISSLIEWLASIPGKILGIIGSAGKALGIDPASGSHPGKDGKPWSANPLPSGPAPGLGSILGIDPAKGGSHPGRDGSPWKKTMFNPGERQIKATPISLSLNVDGQTLAQVISDKIDTLYRYDTSSPTSNGGGRFGV